MHIELPDLPGQCTVCLRDGKPEQIHADAVTLAGLPGTMALFPGAAWQQHVYRGDTCRWLLGVWGEVRVTLFLAPELPVAESLAELLAAGGAM